MHSDLSLSLGAAARLASMKRVTWPSFWMEIDPRFCSSVTSRSGKYLSREFIPLANCESEKQGTGVQSLSLLGGSLLTPSAGNSCREPGCTQSREREKKRNVPKPGPGVCHREKPGGNRPGCMKCKEQLKVRLWLNELRPYWLGFFGHAKLLKPVIFRTEYKPV